MTIWENFHRWPVLMREPEERTVCLPSVILFLSPMFVMFPPQRLSKREVSDGVIAPGYEPEALEILKAKKKRKLQYYSD